MGTRSLKEQAQWAETNLRAIEEVVAERSPPTIVADPMLLRARVMCVVQIFTANIIEEAVDRLTNATDNG